MPLLHMALSHEVVIKVFHGIFGQNTLFTCIIAFTTFFQNE